MKKRSHFPFMIMIIAAAVGLLLSAASAATSAANSGNPAYEINLPLFDKPPKIDGRLDETLWKRAAAIDSFTQYEPKSDIAGLPFSVWF